MLLMLLLFPVGYLVARNNFVYAVRVDVLERSRWDKSTSSFVEYDRLPTYDAMVFQLNTWNYDYVFEEPHATDQRETRSRQDICDADAESR